VTFATTPLRLAAFLSLLPLGLRAQHEDDHSGMARGPLVNSAEFQIESAVVDATRAVTTRFADRRAAIAAGYRRVGMDFPSMGEHWINPSMLVSGSFDRSSPAILTYVTVNGEPRLLGVVYAAVLAPGEKPPSFPGGSAMWHEHNGSVDEESLLPEHGGHEPARNAMESSDGTRLAILHAWTIVPNPAGMFAAENWALPFVRNGIAVPRNFPVSAARELALVSGGVEYYRRLYPIEPSDTELSATQREAHLQRAIAEGRRVLAARKNAAELSPEEIDALASIWDRFSAAVSSR
jgi:hypothetical protein